MGGDKIKSYELSLIGWRHVWVGPYYYGPHLLIIARMAEGLWVSSE